MHHPGQGALARAAFAQEQDRGRGAGRLLQHGHDFLHARGGKIQQQFGVLRLAFLDFPFEPLDALAHLIETLHPRHHPVELFAGKGFFQEIQRAAPHGFDGDVDRALGGENDHREAGMGAEDLGKQIQTVFRGRG